VNDIIQRNSTVDLLRGIASLGVCWFHLTNGNPTFLPPSLLKSSGTYGWLGVEMFFVISGFIIPFALHRSEYQLSNYGIFLLKRIIRLDPPYLAVIVGIICLGYASSATPGFQGEPYHVSMTQILLHFGYINAVFDYPWLNPVFWTLAIEFQYYLLAGLLYPFIRDWKYFNSLGLMLALGLPLLLPSSNLIFHWISLFMLGISTFQYRSGSLSLRCYFCWLVAFTALTLYSHGIVISAVATLTAYAIAFVNIKHAKFITWIGSISYSLYLLHIPIGGRIVNLSSRFAESLPAKASILLFALATSLTTAWILYRFIEHPAQRWSSSITYDRADLKPAVIRL
jgi:peptidoglycan/LPS O-acetylase OafA/YrhL